MLYKKILVAKSPKHTDARNGRIACRGYIHLAVAYIHRSLGINPQLPHCLEDSVGSWFAADILSLANSHLDCVGKEMTAQLDSSIVKFITYHCHIAAIRVESA